MAEDASNCQSASNSEEEEEFFAEIRENHRKRNRSEDEPAQLVEEFLQSPTTTTSWRNSEAFAHNVYQAENPDSIILLQRKGCSVYTRQICFLP